MSKGLMAGLVLLVALGFAACPSRRGARSGLRPRPRLFVGQHSGKDWIPEWDHAKDIWLSCPEVIPVWDGDEADYQLFTFWGDNKWSARLFRNDLGFLLEEDSPDFNRILRDSCNALHYDSAEWLAPLGADRTAATGATDRYDLRELRNGALSTSAIIDKKTGKVWVWTEITSNGKKTGKTAFLSEEVIPEPEK